jgi:hypothetical protein
MSSFAVSIIIFALAQAPAAQGPDTRAEAGEAKLIAEKELSAYELSLGSESSDALQLQATPVLRWTNVLSRRFYGDVFVWTQHGRPEVVASITNVYGPRRAMEVELHSLSLGQPKLDRSGKSVWQPAHPGIELKSVPEAPQPASSSPLRLRQLQSLASQFSASARSGENRTELRLLPRPVFRYASTDPKVLDGALFAFVKGTDPDVFLLLEARKSGEEFHWQYAVARFSGGSELRLEHQRVEVWRAERLSSRANQDPREIYFGLRSNLND